MASILNNIVSLTASRNLASSQKALNRTINRLSTGLRINRASDDAAGLQISNNLRADIRIMGQARRNANDGVGVIQIADGVLEEATNLLTRAAELAEQAASGTTTAAGRAALDQEYTEIRFALDAMGSDTKYDGMSVFGNFFDIRVGETSTEKVSISVASLTQNDLSLNGTDLTTSGNASTAIASVLSAIETVSSNRGVLGAKQARLNTIVNSLGILIENTTAAESQIRDADIATEVVNLTRYQILTQTGVSALAQANASAQSVLSLLG